MLIERDRPLGFDREGVALGAATEFWWIGVRIESDQPWADGLMQRILFGQSGDTDPDGRVVVEEGECERW